MTLTDISYYTRKVVPLLFVGILFFVLFVVLIRAALSLISKPAEEVVDTGPVIDACFGKLPVPDIDPHIDYPSTANFVLDNIEGQPITASSSANVYFLKKEFTQFGYMQRITLMAKTLGIDTEVVEPVLENSNAVYNDGAAELSVDVANFNVEFESDFRQNPDLFTGATVPSETEISETAKQSLRTLGLYKDEFAQGRENIVYLRYDSAEDEFTSVQSPEDANAVEVDFYRGDIQDLPVVSPKYFNSQNYIILLFKNNGHKIIKAQVKFYPREKQEGCLYPLKTGDEAWDELISEQGYIISAGTGSTDIVVRRMFLGYYDPAQYQEYLQPVYLFLGEGGFVGLVPAVREGYVE